MFKKSLTKADYFLIAANLLPVAGVFFWDWSPVQVFMVYALETVIVGLFTLIKIGITTSVRKADTWYYGPAQTKQSGIFFMLFFLVHYGMFVAIQTGMFIQVSGIGKKFDIGFFEFFIYWPRYIGQDAWYMFAAFVISYGVQMYRNFIRPRLYQTIPMMLLMFQPYGRIFIQQVTVILGSMFLVFGAGKIFILIFAFIKIFFELYINFDDILNKTMNELEKKAGGSKYSD